jgi:Uma2 family endonuclease
MVISVRTYEQMALEDGDEQWELARGVLRKKPGMSVEHNHQAMALVLGLGAQLDLRRYTVSGNSARLRVSTGSFYVPDVCVIPRELEARARQERPRRLEVYEEPMPLVVEVWWPFTGDYDVMTKLEEYKQRGDAEIWLIHPHDKKLTGWRRRPAGTYSATVFDRGTVEPVALPGVVINLAKLFD